jgi:hypothetical protein
MTIYVSAHGYGYLTDTARAIVLHEFGHALGFEHEVGRHQAERVDQPLAERCPDEFGTVVGHMLTPYDPDSITNSSYCHWNTIISHHDRLGLSIAYPASYTHAPVPQGAAFVGGDSIIARRGVVLRHRWDAEGAPSSV